MPRVSVLIPAYNRKKLLMCALRSVFAQTCQDFEIVVVDDGSTDGTPEMIRALDHPRLRLLERPHRGSARAWQAGLRVCRGEWIAFLDSDDQWLARKLERQLALADDPEALLIYNPIRWMTPAGRPMSRKPGRLDGWVRECVSRYFPAPICPSAVLVRRRAVLEVGGFDASIGALADLDLWMRLGARFHGSGRWVRFIKQPLALYRMTPRVGRRLAPVGSVWNARAVRLDLACFRSRWMRKRAAAR